MNFNNMYSQYPQYTTPTQVGLTGRLVDSFETAKVAEVPYGSYSVFPKADFSEVYIKSWNANGTTNITMFRPVPIEETQSAKIDVSELKEMNNRLKVLEEKMRELGSTASVNPSPAKEEKKYGF